MRLENGKFIHEMKERIQQFIDTKGISAGELATLLEVQRSNVSHILNGRNKPGASLIEKILLVFPDLNARWLLTGEGKMLEEKAPREIKTEELESVKNETLETKADNRIPGSPVSKKIEKVVLLFSDGTFLSYEK